MIVFILLGILVFTFVFWKGLKEDYAAEMIFNTAIFGLFFSTVLASFTYFLYQPIWFWCGLLGLVVGMLTGIRVYKLRMFEVFDAAIIAFLFLQAILLIGFSIFNGPINLILLAIAAICIILYFILQANYRRFSWYRSGRVGFSGFVVMAVYFFTRSVIAVFNLPVVSLMGVADAAVSAGLTIVSFVVIYTLSRAVA